MADQPPEVTSSVFEDIRVDRRGGIGWVTINRPDLRNASRPQTLQEICDALDQLSADTSVKAIVLTGAGRHFMAGADFQFLEGLKTTPASDIKARIYNLFQGAARRIYNCAKPTVAAIHGAAITVGCELSLACDFRIVTPTAQFQESWVRLGILPPLGGLFLLPRYVGLGRAAQLCLTGQPLNAETAVQAGLALEIVPPEDLEARTQAFAEDLAALPPLAYATIKEGLHRGLASSMESEWAANTSAQAILLTTKDFAEGLDAVREKRAGRFTGT